ncbi:cytochrome P450 [Novosphingobium sp. PASSN1]|uniref:cytochrome P450 n=1 Tax=Novosphingobium sp. PASSN1 TaxID=2015561 RepID=UPI0025E99A61|nr:cytochrome P450 [Novosphingobium sp. PASSN1]
MSTSETSTGCPVHHAAMPTEQNTVEAIGSLLANFDAHSPVFVENREDVIAAIHASGCPVLHSDLYGGFTLFGRYQTVVDVHQHEEAYSTRYKSLPTTPGMPNLIPSARSGDEHQEYRRLLNPHFSAKAIKAHAGRMREVVDQLIDEGIERGTFDMVMDVGQPLVGIMTMEMAGLTVDAWREYVEPIHMATFRTGTPEEIGKGWANLTAWIRKDIAGLRDTPKGILGDLIVNARYNERPLTDEELELITINLLIGGLGTSQGFIGTMAVYLASHPDERRLLIEEPALRRVAIEELLRFYSPQTMSARTVLQDVEVEGVAMKPDDRLLIAYCAGNLDPTKFADPMTINLRRWPNKHMAFGIGPHTCIGRHFALAMISACLDSLLEKAPDFQIVESGVQRVENISSITGYRNVPVSVDKR